MWFGKARSRKKLRKRILTMTVDEWEATCLRCGCCCVEREMTDDGDVVAWGAPCAYLDVATRLCRDYERRFQLDTTCKRITPRLVLSRAHLLPPLCAYRRMVEGEELARQGSGGRLSSETATCSPLGGLPTGGEGAP